MATFIDLNCLKACNIHHFHCISPLKLHIYLPCACNRLLQIFFKSKFAPVIMRRIWRIFTIFNRIIFVRMGKIQAHASEYANLSRKKTILNCTKSMVFDFVLEWNYLGRPISTLPTFSFSETVSM